MATGGGDGLAVGLDKVEAARAVGQMLIEPSLHFGIEPPLRIGKEEPVDVAATEAAAQKLPDTIHSIVDAGERVDDSLIALIKPLTAKNLTSWERFVTATGRD
jgi:hypothetical protein